MAGRPGTLAQIDVHRRIGDPIQQYEYADRSRAASAGLHATWVLNLDPVTWILGRTAGIERLGGSLETYHVKAYGLHLQVPFPCPPLDAVSSTEPPDVEVRIGSIPETLPGGETIHQNVQGGGDRIQLQVPGVMSILAEKGRSITLDPCPGTPTELLRIYLLGSGMGAILQQRGFLPIHGSCVVTPAGAALFVGPQGIGKSTLASHFRKRGYPVLADDITVLQTTTDGICQVVPGIPQVRLCRDALERLGGDPEAILESDKFLVPVRTQFHRTPVRLRWTFFLAESPGPDFQLERLRGFPALDRFLANVYRPMFLRGLDVRGATLAMAAQAVECQTLFEARRPRDSERIESFIDFLEIKAIQKGA